jgi:hypothetical protein
VLLFQGDAGGLGRVQIILASCLGATDQFDDLHRPDWFVGEDCSELSTGLSALVIGD